MGRFDPSYVAGQKVFLIWHGRALVGFMSFHATPDEWSLDLIRHAQDLPDGAMHVAVSTAIDAARNAGVTRLSLAAVPVSPTTTGWLARCAASKSGLYQFKNSFRPVWEPRYHLAPTRPVAILSAIAITVAVHRPIARILFAVNKILHNHVAWFSFEEAAKPWQLTRDPLPIQMFKE